jgi:hypothetical protein
MALDKRYQPTIPADSVTLLRMDFYGGCQLFNAQGSTQSGRRMRFLEIDTTAHGRCFERPQCNLSQAPIREQAVLQASYRLFCGEEGVACGGVVEFRPRSWWQREIVDFVVIDIGVIYIECFGAIMIVIAGITTLVVLAVRRTRTRAKQAAFPR